MQRAEGKFSSCVEVDLPPAAVRAHGDWTDQIAQQHRANRDTIDHGFGRSELELERSDLLATGRRVNGDRSWLQRRQADIRRDDVRYRAGCRGRSSSWVGVPVYPSATGHVWAPELPSFAAPRYGQKGEKGSNSQTSISAPSRSASKHAVCSSSVQPSQFS